jgi:hypothetical protein
MPIHVSATFLILAVLGGCTGVPLVNDPRPVEGASPLDTDPGGDDLALTRTDLLATASARYGRQALGEALAASAYLIAKRFAGMAPPPPEGAGPDWVPPTPSALLMKGPDGWMVATGGGWRPAASDAAAELDRALADPRFWSEPAFIPPCPDYGSSVLLLKMPGREATVRKSTCTSAAEKAVFAALAA